jgi:hypothetical protein
MRKLFVVVLYKRTLLDCPTYISLRQTLDVLTTSDKVVFWDNSPEPADNDALKVARHTLQPVSLEYIHTPKNLALSRIYNHCIANNQQYDLLILLDQDSSFTASYLVEITDSVCLHQSVNLFVPLIVQDNLIVSPGSFNGFKGKYWRHKRYGLVEARGNIVITSGMAVRLSYFKQFGKFEERLNLYGIDTNFSVRYGRQNDFFYVLRTPFHHDLSDFNEESVASKERRFKNFSRASLINAELFPFYIQFLARLFITYKGFMNALKYRKLSFIKLNNDE